MFNTADRMRSPNYSRIVNAAQRILSQRGWEAYDNGDSTAIVTKKQGVAIESRKTHQGRMNTIGRAASGQSVG